MAETPTRRSLVAAAVTAASLLLLGCSGNSGTNASTATDAGEFDVSEATPLGQVIPADARESAPAFSGELLDGSEFDSQTLDGDITVLNSWGSWCAPCRVETPEFQAVYDDVAEDATETGKPVRRTAFSAQV